MKLFNKTLLFLPLVLMSVLVNFAQPPAPPPPPPPAKPSKMVGKAEFFEFKDQVSASSEFLKRDKQSITITYDNPLANRGKNPESVFMIFQSNSDNGLKYKENHRLKILFEGKVAIESDTKVVMSSCNPKKKEECYEAIFTPKFPFQVFEQMQKLNKVEIMFGDTVFELTGEEKLHLMDVGATTKL